MISRDGAQIYASAAKKSHPEVVQVSDRFHIIKGLPDAVIHKIITEKGYDGSVASLRMFMQKEKIKNQAAISQEDICSDYLPKEYV